MLVVYVDHTAILKGSLLKQFNEKALAFRIKGKRTSFVCPNSELMDYSDKLLKQKYVQSKRAKSDEERKDRNKVVNCHQKFTNDE